MLDRGPLIIVGASVRAAAMSAIRAGYRPYGIDLFADRDLRRIAECQRVGLSDYPAGIGRLLHEAPPGPWMYTGGLENYPELIEEWRRDRELIGNGADVLSKVRDPKWLCEHLPFAPTAFDGIPAVEKGRWIRKPLRSAGGANIAMWDGEALPTGTYLQRFIPGQPVSGTFVAEEQTCRFIGSTRQLIGESWLHAPTFQYCGNVGPRNLSADETIWWNRVGSILHQEARIRGVVGVDAIANDPGLTVIEVNPRYPASAEVLELTLGVSLFAKGDRPHPKCVIGKAIYFAPHPLRFPQSGPWAGELDCIRGAWNPPSFADIPAPAEMFQPGNPVITMIAQSRGQSECQELLKVHASELDQLMRNCRGEFSDAVRQ